MTEIKRTLAILKTRWPEVTLIISLDVLSLLSGKLLLIVQTKTTPLNTLIVSSWRMAIFIIIVLLTTGFQRTVYLEGPKKQSLITLLRIGKHFFWRMIGFGLIYIPVFGILVWLTFLTIRLFASIETGFWETAKAAPFVYQLCFTVPALILIKPLLLIFPLIIVLDCRISKSFKLLKKCKLLDARELIILFLISMAGTFLWIFLPSIKSATVISQYIFIIARLIIQRFIGLMIAVMAVRFAASQNLEYDDHKPSENLNFEDLRKYANRELKE